MFIDEAYLFNPAPKGSTANDSNKGTLLRDEIILPSSLTIFFSHLRAATSAELSHEGRRDPAPHDQFYPRRIQRRDTATSWIQ